MSYRLTIAGMSCDHCVRRVTKALSGIDGVRITQVEVGRAEIDAADAAAVARAVASLGAVGYAAEVSP
jgi:copper chaperone CopZ